VRGGRRGWGGSVFNKALRVWSIGRLKTLMALTGARQRWADKKRRKSAMVAGDCAGEK